MPLRTEEEDDKELDGLWWTEKSKMAGWFGPGEKAVANAGGKRYVGLLSSLILFLFFSLSC
jgi:hypothetical protein